MLPPTRGPAWRAPAAPPDTLSPPPPHLSLPSHQAKDLSQQVARLLHEVQVLQSGLPREAAGATSPGAAGFGGGTAADVTTQRLVEFKDIEVGGLGCCVGCLVGHRRCA